MNSELTTVMAKTFSNYIGPGSLPKNRVYVENELPGILLEYDIYSVNDAGCGLGWIGGIIGDTIEYRAFDILPRDNAEVLDITQTVMPMADLIICRDVLFHLTDDLVKKAIDNFRESGAKYLLATSCYETSHRRPAKFNGDAINAKLDIIPMMGEPLARIEEPFDKRFMGLWKL